MSRLRKTLAGVAVVISLAAPPVFAQAPPDERDGGRDIEESVRESIENIMRAIEGLIDSVPIYEMPEILENGDIIIRRKKRDPAPEPGKPAPNGDSSST